MGPDGRAVNLQIDRVVNTVKETERNDVNIYARTSKQKIIFTVEDQVYACDTNKMFSNHTNAFVGFFTNFTVRISRVNWH